MGPGLWLTSQLYGPDANVVCDFQAAIGELIEFYVSGYYSIGWKTSNVLGTVDTPFIDDLKITQLGYINKQNKTTNISVVVS
jgi:hypothetical protein